VFCCLDFFPALWILQVGTISWYFLTLIFNQYFFFKKDVSRSRNDTAVSAVLLHMLVVRTLMAGIISCGLACTELISVRYEFGWTRFDHKGLFVSLSYHRIEIMVQRDYGKVSSLLFAHPNVCARLGRRSQGNERGQVQGRRQSVGEVVTGVRGEGARSEGEAEQRSWARS
jgi:hypothetical protein